MLGYAWKSLGWFLAGVAVALGFLLVPLQVAAERKKLDRTVSQIAAAHRDIRALETEFDTRANLAQLEQWNGDTLRLTAPGGSPVSCVTKRRLHRSTCGNPRRVAQPCRLPPTWSLRCPRVI